MQPNSHWHPKAEQEKRRTQLVCEMEDMGNSASSSPPSPRLSDDLVDELVTGVEATFEEKAEKFKFDKEMLSMKSRAKIQEGHSSALGCPMIQLDIA